MKNRKFIHGNLLLLRCPKSEWAVWDSLTVMEQFGGKHAVSRQSAQYAMRAYLFRYGRVMVMLYLSVATSNWPIKAIEGFRKDCAGNPSSWLSRWINEWNDGNRVLRRHLEKSMKNLRTDYIDLYYLHRVNTAVPVEDVAEAMGQLIGEGIIRGWGLSQVGVGTLEEKSCRHTGWRPIQNLYSMLERDCEKDIFPYCLKHDIGVVPFSPIASGFLSGKVTCRHPVRHGRWCPAMGSAVKGEYCRQPTYSG